MKLEKGKLYKIGQKKINDMAVTNMLCRKLHDFNTLEDSYDNL